MSTNIQTKNKHNESKPNHTKKQNKLFINKIAYTAAFCNFQNILEINPENTFIEDLKKVFFFIVLNRLSVLWAASFTLIFEFPSQYPHPII